MHAEGSLLLLLITLSFINLLIYTSFSSLKTMEKSQKSHFLKLALIALLFSVAPLVPSSVRPPYLYFLLNLLIIALGAEAGLLSFLNPQDEKRPAIFAPKPIDFTARVTTEASPRNEVNVVVENDKPAVISNENPEVIQKKVRRVEKSVSAKVVSTAKVHKLKKSPSTPSLFFIGSGETDAEETIYEYEEEYEYDECLSKEELYTKAEKFIGNFYSQLKIQREDSWRKIHDLYHKAF